MQAGKLRQRVKIEKPRFTRAGDASIEAWDQLCEVWADVEPNQLTAGRETWWASQMLADVTHTVTIRYRADVQPNYRVNHRGRYLNVLAVLDVGERRRELQLLCREVPAQA